MDSTPLDKSAMPERIRSLPGSFSGCMTELYHRKEIWGQATPFQLRTSSLHGPSKLWLIRHDVEMPAAHPGGIFQQLNMAETGLL